MTSDTSLMVLQAIRAVQGAPVADDIAAGYVDGAARYWQDDDEIVEASAAQPAQKT